MYKVSLIFGSDIAAIWPDILPYIERVATISDGRITAAKTLDRFLKNELNCWIIYGENPIHIVGYMATRFNQYDAIKLMIVEQLGGEDLDNWIYTGHEALEILAKHEGCAGLEQFGRLAWTKKLKRFGWEVKFTAMQKLF